MNEKTPHPLTEDRAIDLVRRMAMGVAFQICMSVAPEDLLAYARATYDIGRAEWEPSDESAAERAERNAVDALCAARKEGWDEAADWLDSRACPNAAHNLRAANPYRPARDLPEDPGVVIVAADGLDGIKAVRDSDEWGAAEAVLGADGQWHGVWREDLGQGVFGSVPPEWITPGTWKVDEQ